VLSVLACSKVVCSFLQVVNPKKDLPNGLLGSLGVVTVLYMLMSATIVLMVPYTDISSKAAFAAAFQARHNRTLLHRSLPIHESVSHTFVQCCCAGPTSV